MQDQQNNQIQLISANETAYVDSRIVAPRLGISHQAMLKSISYHWEKFSHVGCVKCAEPGTGPGRPTAYVLLTRRAVMLLPVICTTTPAIIEFQSALIDAFEEMEARLRGVNPIHPTPQIDSKFLLQISQQMAELESALAIAAPKVAFAEAIAHADRDWAATDVAKSLGIRPKALIEALVKHSWYYYQSRITSRGETARQLRSHSNAIQSGYVSEGSEVALNGMEIQCPRVTVKGREYIVTHMLEWGLYE